MDHTCIVDGAWFLPLDDCNGGYEFAFYDNGCLFSLQITKEPNQSIVVCLIKTELWLFLLQISDLRFVACILSAFQTAPELHTTPGTDNISIIYRTSPLLPIAHIGYRGGGGRRGLDLGNCKVERQRDAQ